MNVGHNGLKNGASVILFIGIKGIMRMLTNVLQYYYEKFLEKDNWWAGNQEISLKAYRQAWIAKFPRMYNKINLVLKSHSRDVSLASRKTSYIDPHHDFQEMKGCLKNMKRWIGVDIIPLAVMNKFSSRAKICYLHDNIFLLLIDA